ADVIESAGHQATMVNGGAEAIERFRAESFDVVLTDLAMPRVSGWQVASAVKHIAPRVPVFLVTGFGVELTPEERRAHGVDLVLVTESAKLTMAYSKIAATPDGSSSYFLPRLVGLRRAMELYFTNRVLTAREALDWGLVTRVVPDAEFKGAVDALARELAQ